MDSGNRKDSRPMIRADWFWDWGEIDIRIFEKEYDGYVLAKVEDVVFVKHERGDLLNPAMRVSKEDAQALMDDLWRIGVRPSNSPDTGDELKATQRHLLDMRQLAFTVLKVDKPVEGGIDGYET